jgi:hypothetical protein
MPLKTRPGTLYRAAGAFALLNVIMFVTIFAVVTVAPFARDIIWVQAVASLMIIALELVITMTTIAEPLYNWVKGEYYEEDKRS